MSHKEYPLIQMNLSEDPAKKAKYSKLKQKLIKKHISDMKSAVNNQSEFSMRERLVEISAPNENEWPKNALIQPHPEKTIPSEEIKKSIEEYEKCISQENAIKEYLDYLNELKINLQNKITDLSSGNTEFSLGNNAEITEQSEMLKKLKEELGKKEKLDQELIKNYSDFIVKQNNT